ncbi:hypothetical protein CHH62_03725 [Niallia circulans]|uniref:hypothetical protein n=1 Tax=Niallia circulans TaxID=1397 RepID=UPI000BA6AC40|nr:hypothetical protein [Niallia circulans]PAD27219.1 hypothetical protein CHH62_03725 [Niallia circulans]
MNEILIIINNIKWESKEAEMIRLSDYIFYQSSNNNDLYRLWISPEKNKITLINGKKGYVQLSEDESDRLFYALTNKHLKDL